MRNKKLAWLEMVRSPSCRAKFSTYKDFGSPSRVSSVKVRNLDHAFELLAWEERLNFFLLKTLAKADSA